MSAAEIDMVSGGGLQFAVAVAVLAGLVWLVVRYRDGIRRAWMLTRYAIGCALFRAAVAVIGSER